MSEATTSCPKCGAAIPPEAPQGLCPKCLLKQASFPTETGPTTRHTRPTAPDRDELSAAFPHLQILELIGQGGMGFVYKARQPKLDRIVALKILAQPLAEQTMFAERFTREGRTLAKLNHPNIVTIHDFGQAGPFFYLLMEYVDGVNLRQAMRAGAVNSAQALAIVPRICEALQYAHNEGVLHRDIKPDNILLDTRGRVKIADFGIAKLMAEAIAENPLTGSGASLGTPHYMAPEQIEKPNSVDHRADIYSLGVVFYEMLTGELPLGRFAAPSETSGIDPRLDEVVFQTLEKQPERRPQSADEVKTRVETISAYPQSSESSKRQVTFKMSRCYISTPEFLKTWIGHRMRYTGKGELRLDPENLTFEPSHGNWIVIPLRAITGFALDEYRLLAVRGLKRIAVTFTEKGQTHRLFFIPNKGPLRPVWETNRHVEEWFAAIQNAIKVRTGRLPASDEGATTPTSQTSYGNPVLKAAFTFALLIVVGLGVGLGAFIGLYALLRKSTPNPKEATATQAPLIPSMLTATPDTSNGPSRTLSVGSLYSANNNGLGFRTSTEPAAGERFVPVIRFGEGPWGEPDNAATRLEYLRTSQGPIHNGTYTWTLPTSFNSGYETAAAVIRARASAEREPITIYTNFVRPIFELSNPSFQTVAVGLRLQKSAVVPPNPPIIAKLTQFGGRFAGNDGDRPRLNGWATPEIPAGYRVQAVGKIVNQVITAKTYENGNAILFFWYFPDDMDPSISSGIGAFTPPFTKIDLAYGEPLTIYTTKTKSGETFTASLELVPLPGITPPKITPQSKPPKVETPEPPAETLDLTFVGATLKPRKLTLRAKGFILPDDNISVITGHPETQAQSSSRAGHPFGGRDILQNYSAWTCTRGLTNDEVAELIWTFSERYSADDDLGLATGHFFGANNRKRIQLTAGKPTTLFSITNAFGEVSECTLLFTKRPALVKDPKAGIIITRASGNADTNGVYVDLGAAFPKGVAIEAIGHLDETAGAGATVLSRSLQENSLLNVKWLFPAGFVPEPNTPAKSSAPKPSSPGVIIPLQPAPQPVEAAPLFLQPLVRRIEAGDARITTKPLEVFAVTNSQGQVFRGLLQIARSEAGRPSAQIQDAPTGPIKEFPLRFKTRIQPNTLTFEAPIDLAFDESIRSMIRYNDGKWDDNNYASTYRVAAGPPISRTLSLSWNLPENFSFPFDVKPVLDDVFGGQKTKLVRLSTNHILELFSLTNALKQKVSCGLRYTRLTSSGSDIATITNTLLRGDSLGVTLEFYGLTPAGTRVEPVVTYGTNNYFEASLDRTDFRNAEARFGIPAKLPRFNIPYPKVLELRRGERGELFSLTNSDNQVFRAFLELGDVTK